MADLAAIFSAGASALGPISRLFGGGKSSAEKKAASIARRNARANAFISALTPASDKVSSSVWNQLQQQAVTCFQTGCNHPALAETIIRGGEAFATEANDIIQGLTPQQIGLGPRGSATLLDLKPILSARLQDAVEEGFPEPDPKLSSKNLSLALDAQVEQSVKRQLSSVGAGSLFGTGPAAFRPGDSAIRAEAAAESAFASQKNILLLGIAGIVAVILISRKR